MAVDFEINDSTDWGDNGLNDLHSVLFDHKVPHGVGTDATDQAKHTKRNLKKKKKSRSDNTNGSEEELVKIDTTEEVIKKKQKYKKQDKAKISGYKNETQKAIKRKGEDNVKTQEPKKKKALSGKKAEKRKIKQDDENEELVNDYETEEEVDEKKKKKRKKKKVDESQDGTKPLESEVKVTEGQLKKKKKKTKKAVNKFKTDEFLNMKKLCGKFVDLSAPPTKVPKKEHKIIPIKEKNSEIIKVPKESKDGKKKQTKKEAKQNKKKQNEKVEKENEDENIAGTDSVTKSPELNKKKPIDLRTKMENKLKGARFRFINEKLYTCTGDSALELFTEDQEAFQVYHDGFVEQVKSWPVNPVDKMIEDLKKMPPSKIVGDFGCGDAKIAKNVKQKVHSFDLVSTKENVIACNMANVPLSDNEIDVAVFCLSLMGTNWIDYLKEANRVLKNKGILKISEVSSRFQNLKAFILAMKRLGFSQIHKDTSNKFFISFDFKKQSSPKEISEGMNEILKPCLYKKR